MGISKRELNNVVFDDFNDTPDYLSDCPDCPICGGTMGYSYNRSEFKCFNCGCIMDENDLVFDDFIEDDIPWGCKTCGGPYPLCTTSCKMFDE